MDPGGEAVEGALARERGALLDEVEDGVLVRLVPDALRLLWWGV